MWCERIRRYTGGVLVAVALFASTGCEETTDNVTGISTDTNVENISIADVRQQVEMSDEQAAKLEAALNDLRQAQRARRGNPDAFDDVRPGLEFVARAAEILDRQQLVAFLETIHEQRRERMAERRSGNSERPREGFGPLRRHGQGPGSGPGMGPGAGMGHGPRLGQGPGGGLHGLLRQLDLDDAQRDRVRDALHTLQATMQQLHESRRAGELSDEAFRDAVNAAHATFETALGEILTAEQTARLQQLQREQAEKQLTRMIERLRTNQDKHLDLLVRILGLSAEQRAGFAAAGNDLLTGLETLLQSVRDGSVSHSQMRETIQQLHQTARDAIRALLDDEQAALFDALHRWHPRGPRP